MRPQETGEGSSLPQPFSSPERLIKRILTCLHVPCSKSEPPLPPADLSFPNASPICESGPESYWGPVAGIMVSAPDLGPMASAGHCHNVCECHCSVSMPGLLPERRMEALEETCCKGITLPRAQGDSSPSKSSSCLYLSPREPWASEHQLG